MACHTGHNLKEVLEELNEIDRKNGYKFGFSLYPDAYSGEMWGILWELENLDLLRTGRENPHLILTRAGMAWGKDCLEFSELGEIAIHDYLEGLRKSRLE